VPSQRTAVEGVAQRILRGTAAGAGATEALTSPLSTFTMQTVVTGAPTAVSVTLEGSLDGSNWTTIATSTSTTGDQQYAVDKPQTYVRANLGTLTGGTSPVVTVYLAALP